MKMLCVLLTWHVQLPCIWWSSLSTAVCIYCCRRANLVADFALQRTKWVIHLVNSLRYPTYLHDQWVCRQLLTSYNWCTITMCAQNGQLLSSHLCAMCLFTYRVVGIFVHLHYVNIQPYMFWQFFDQWNTKTCRILYTISSLSWSVMGTSKSRNETKQKPCSH